MKRSAAVPVSMIEDPTIDPNMLRVYAIISLYDEGQGCPLSRADLAEKAVMSESTVTRATNELAERGFIKTTYSSTRGLRRATHFINRSDFTP